MYIQSRCFGFRVSVFAGFSVEGSLSFYLRSGSMTVCFLLQLIASRDTVLVVRHSNCLIRCNLKTVQASSCPLHAIRYSRQQAASCSTSFLSDCFGFCCPCNRCRTDDHLASVIQTRTLQLRLAHRSAKESERVRERLSALYWSCFWTLSEAVRLF